MATSTSILHWPGKSPLDDSGVSHPAVYHMLDVGAVLELLLKRASFEEPLHQALCLLGTLHDIGKINPDFRDMIEGGKTQSWRHWRVSMAFLEYFSETALASLGDDCYVKTVLYAAVAGHHGGPPTDLRREMQKMTSRAGVDCLKDVATTIDAFSELFPEASLQSLEDTLEEAGGDWRKSSRAISWWLSGVVSVADWIGSNTEWFPPTAPEIDVPAYWEIARKKAVVALQRCGLDLATPSNKPACTLFDFKSYTPMQQAVLEASIPDGPTLVVIEDATGSGKTESGLMLAQRMMQAGKGEGLFFALPTMATANAMFSRLTAMRHMFEGEPSLALMHSRAGFHEQFRKIVGRRVGEPDDQISCADWFVDGRRKALLAQIGVGTIDQVLLGVLPTRYCTLRLYALSRQILIVDEAHDYDSYMQVELERLLTFQGMLGGSVILMTATLPQVMREKYIQAFHAGARMGVDDIKGNSYPQLSIVGADRREIKKIDAMDDAKAPVSIERMDSLDSAIDLLVNAAEAGAACAFIRNSVDEAILALDALRVRGIKAYLHHARFALCDRLDNEIQILDTFGKSEKEHSGAVVVGTQVLEQSLDIDFDLMITDLAPIGALIQRAGRLWRHKKRHRPINEPTLYVLAPDPDDVQTAQWGREVLGQGWFVYSLPILWRTARVLFAAGRLVSPSTTSQGNVRMLIEAVDGYDKEDPPESLVHAENERIGSTLGDRAHAEQNLLKPLTGDYSDASDVFSDESFPTRLGPEQMTLRLARWEDDELRPWSNDVDPARAWAMSEVSVSLYAWRKLVVDDRKEPAVQKILDKLKEWERERYEICPVEKNGYIGGTGLRYTQEVGIVFPGKRRDEPQ